MGSIDRFIKKCNEEYQECVEKTDAVQYAIDILSEGIPYTIQKTILTDAVQYAIDILSEGIPYTIQKTILNENIYIWNESFIDRVIESLSTTIVQKFSSKEKDLFDRYRNFLIFNVTDVVDEDVQKLDEYLGNL